MKQQKVDDGPMVHVMEPAADVINCLLWVALQTISEFKRGYRPYRGIADDDTGRPADFPTDVVDDLDDNFVLEVLWEGDLG